MNKGELAEKLFHEGYNCAQAVACAFADDCGMDEKLMFKIASSFGGGMGRMREVCGCVSGMFVVSGILECGSSAVDKNEKDSQYARVQLLAEKFKKECGSIICRELLALPTKTVEKPISEERTQEYYTKRPCSQCVRIAADILAAHLSANAD